MFKTVEAAAQHAMKYSFNILGVSPVAIFFQQQLELNQTHQIGGVEYIASPKCSLDSFINSVEQVGSNRGWDLDEMIATILEFWLQSSETINYWKSRLEDAGAQNLLVARVANFQGIQQELELILRKNL